MQQRLKTLKHASLSVLLCLRAMADKEYLFVCALGLYASDRLCRFKVINNGRKITMYKLQMIIMVAGFVGLFFDNGPGVSPILSFADATPSVPRLDNYQLDSLPA